MSELELDKPPVHDFSAIGVDAEVAQLIIGDLAPDNPDCAENAGIWAGLVIEGAQQIARESDADVVDREEFLGYMFKALKQAGAVPTEVNSFVWSLGYDEIVQRTDLPGSSRGSERGIIWRQPTERIEKFVTGCFERELLLKQMQRLQSHYETNIGNMTAEELEAHLIAYSDIRQAFEEADGRTRQQSDDRESTRKLDFLRKFEPILEETAPDPELHRQYGAKGANLLQLQAVLEKMREAGIEITEYLSIPEFTLVSVDAYKDWAEGISIGHHVAGITKWIRQRPGARFVIRSSAAFSEDGENTGAGIYDSVMLPENPTSAAVLQAVKTVYGSVDSEKAKAYRESIGVDHEEMGLVIQEVADASYLHDTTLGTINTVMTGVPELMDYSIAPGAHELVYPDGAKRLPLPLSRSGAFRQLGVMPLFSPYMGEPRFHVPPDTYKHHLFDSWMVVQAALIAEKVAGRPIQMEFCLDSDVNKVHILQARPLPKDMLEPQPFAGFPENGDEPMFVGRSIGIVDGQEAVVRHDIFGMSTQVEANEEHGKATLFVADNSFGRSKSLGYIIEDLSELSEEQRKKVIVLVAESAESGISGGGHLETLFAELGITLICYKPGAGYASKPDHGQSVKIYSNGYEGRIYPSQRAVSK